MLEEESAQPDESSFTDGVDNQAEVTVPKYKIGETEYDESVLKQALEDHQNKEKWQKSYTERDMTLAEERKSISQAKLVQEFLDKNPQAYSEVEGVFKKYNPETGKVEADPKYSKLEQELSTIKETIATREAYSELQSEMASLKTKYADHFASDPKLEAEVVKFAYDKNIMDMEAAFKAYAFDTVKSKSIEEGMQRGKKSAINSRSLGTPSGTAGASKGLNLKGSWNDVAAQIASKFAD